MILGCTLKNLFLSLFTFVLITLNALALDPNVQELINYETRANAVATRSNQQVQIEHYEIPLSLVGSDLADRMDPQN